AGELRTIAGREADLRRAVADADGRALAAERRANGRTAQPAGELEPLLMEAQDLSARAAEAAAMADDAAERAGSVARALAEADPGRRRRPSELVLTRLVGGAERLEAALAIEVERFEAPVRERAEAQTARTSELGAELRRLGAEEVEVRQAASAAGEKLAAIDEELARYEKRREQLGQVNPLAKEEYEAEKERLEELSVQRADLEKSLDELEK